MTRLATRFLSVGLLMLGLFTPALPQLLAQAKPNQVATLHWYPAITGLSFPVAARVGFANDQPRPRQTHSKAGTGAQHCRQVFGRQIAN